MNLTDWPIATLPHLAWSPPESRAELAAVPVTPEDLGKPMSLERWELLMQKRILRLYRGAEEARVREDEYPTFRDLIKAVASGVPAWGALENPTLQQLMREIKPEHPLERQVSSLVESSRFRRAADVDQSNLLGPAENQPEAVDLLEQQILGDFLVALEESLMASE
ncbi:MAG: hypothetical protein PHE83_18955 [Opitutaceae bacterium]|nr:hypothetical protein [Opitutaceae bacterium]